jgi:heme o synthase
MKPFYELARVPLSLLTSCSAGVGYALAAERGTLHRFWEPMAAVFFLAAGASAVNQVQERRYDALMERTKGRPVPSGRISPASAAIFGIVLIMAGLVFLIWEGGLHPSSFILHPFYLGLFSILWYNGFYTHAKRAGAFAAVPGALVGAVPPAIGWTLAGGSLADPPILMLMVFLFLWQVPHFWLVVLLREGEYRAAGYPVPTDRIPPARLRAVVFSWIAAALMLCLLMPLFGLIHNRPLYLAVLFPAAAAMGACALQWILRAELNAPNIRKTFIAVNAFALVVLMIVTADKLLQNSSEFGVRSSEWGEQSSSEFGVRSSEWGEQSISEFGVRSSEWREQNISELGARCSKFMDRTGDSKLDTRYSILFHSCTPLRITKSQSLSSLSELLTPGAPLFYPVSELRTPNSELEGRLVAMHA